MNSQDKISNTVKNKLIIGGINIFPNTLFAPMSGVTGSALRRLVRIFSKDCVGLVATEFLSVEALTRDNVKTAEKLLFHDSEHPISVQLFGADPDRMAQAANQAQKAGADIIDLNSGCPAPKVVRVGGGADLHRNPELFSKILRSMKRELSVPLTVKIRSGWSADQINAVEMALLAEAEGVEMICVHPRTKKQHYSGKADWNITREVRKAVKIPVVGNGDIVKPSDAVEKMEETGVQGIMVGRAAASNPWLFRQIADYRANRPIFTPTTDDIRTMLTIFLDLLKETLPVKVINGRLKHVVVGVSRGLPQSSKMRGMLRICKTAEATLALCMSYLSWVDQYSEYEEDIEKNLFFLNPSVVS